MGGVIGRDTELAVVKRFIDEVDRGPSALVLAGEAGIGKTLLWQVGVERAEGGLGRSLCCHGTEAEAALSFAALSELLEPVLASVLDQLVLPRRRALAVALLIEEPEGQPPDSHAVGLAMLDVLRVLAASGPLVVAIDDAQWLDPASAGALQVALRRLRDEPVGLLATVREPSSGAVGAELDRCFAETRRTRVEVGSLELSEFHRLLPERLGLELSRGELAQLHAATRGNPFFALEVGRERLRSPVLRPDQPVPVPANLARLLGQRLARLSPDARTVLVTVACAARPTVALVTDANGNAALVERALAEAAAEGVIEQTGGRLRFVHPLFASVVIDQASPRLRADALRALAAVVSDVEERARYLDRAADAPDPFVAEELARAAEVAARRGAVPATAELYELAAARDPTNDAARAWLFVAARARRLSGDVGSARDGFEMLLATAPPGRERCDILAELAMTFGGDPRRELAAGAPERMRELLDEALAEAGDDDERAVLVLGRRVGVHLWRADALSALTDARASFAGAERLADPLGIAVAITRLGLAENFSAQATPGLLERGVELEQQASRPLESFETPRLEMSRLWRIRGEVDRARAMLETLAAEAGDRGEDGSLLMIRWRLGELEWSTGRWADARRHADEAFELVHQTDHAHGRFWIARVKALIETDLGLLDEAADSARESLELADAAANVFYRITSHAALGRIELARADHEAAHGHLAQLPGQLEAGGIADPTMPVWSDAIENLIAVGELARAREHLERYEESAARIASPWGIGVAARARSLLEAAHDDPAVAVVAASRAVEVLTASPHRFERARALLTLGEMQRHAQQRGAARVSLESALVVFVELGARLWTERAAAELGRISGRRPALGQLTESERQVASLAAAGRSNREIAADLHMGTSTVESHLTHVYRKLHVRRAELATRLWELEKADGGDR